MTDAVATPSGGRWRRAATWLAHQQPALLACALAVFLYDAVVASPTSLLLVWVAMCAVTVSVFAEGFHNLTLCSICARAIPIDGQEQARVRSDWLRLHHRLSGVMWSVLLFAGCLTVLITLRVHRPRPRVHPQSRRRAHPRGARSGASGVDRPGR
jgi:hypothetical protein